MKKKPYKHPVVTEETAILMAKGFAQALIFLADIDDEEKTVLLEKYK